MREMTSPFHVGILVADIPAAMEQYSAAGGLTWHSVQSLDLQILIDGDVFEEHPRYSYRCRLRCDDTDDCIEGMLCTRFASSTRDLDSYRIDLCAYPCESGDCLDALDPTGGNDCTCDVSGLCVNDDGDQCVQLSPDYGRTL